MASDTTQLDSEQRAAVEAKEAAIAVLAGPGSGKTKVLSLRARHLLGLYPKHRALLLTFTNKAAAEMKARAQSVAVPSSRLLACNFHTFAAEVLRKHGDHVGIQPGFDILDDAEARELQNQIGVGRLANHGDPWSKARVRKKTPLASVAEFGALYEAEKRRQGVVDFDDLVVYTAQLFESKVDIAKAYAIRFPHILIDEFQDTNAVQFAIVRALWASAETISVFADDDQAIYGWAGADVAHIRRFVEDLEAKGYQLTTNYRCRSEIVAKANLLLQADSAASGRRMKSALDGGSVQAKVFTSTTSEAASIAKDIAARIEAGTRADDIGVLVKSRPRAEHLSAALLAEGVPISDWLGERYNQKQRRALRTCFAVVRKELSRRHLDNLGKLYNFKPGDETQTDAMLRQHLEVPGVSELHAMHQGVLRGESVEQLLAHVQKSLATVDQELAESLDDVVESVRAFTAHDAEFSLDHLLSELALGGAGGAPTKGGGVKLATLHRTKGLQWPCVYLVGLEHDTLPDFRVQTDADVSAERRVCFVGVCRAETDLILTRVQTLKGH